MKKHILIFTLILALTFPSFTFASNVQTTENNTDINFFMGVLNYIKEIYPFEIDDKTLIEGGLKGMLQSVDQYSDYYTVEEATEIYNNMFNTFSGIGVYIEEKDNYINILETIKDSPAEKAGLKKGDLIFSIGKRSAKNMSIEEARKLIQGEKGTKIRLGILRKGEKRPFNIYVTRDTITINPVEYKILEDNIGYIRLREFSSTSTTKMKEALKYLDNKNADKIVLDIRDNPGGLLNEAIEISKLFTPKGPVVHIKEKGKALVTHMSTTTNTKYKLVLLVNENSASASEILAGAVKDTKAGIIIGKKTFGKGIVQSIMNLQNGSMIKLTTAEYLTPNKTSIHGKGIEPDIIVENTGEVDKQLNKAIEFIK